MASSAPRRMEKMATGRKSGTVKNAGTQTGSQNATKPIKNAVGMCGVGGQGYAKIKGAVSG